MNTSPQHPVHIRNQIEQLQREKQALALPDLAALEAAITFHGARTNSVDPQTAGHHQRAMADAMTAKDQAEQNWKRAQAINSEVASLNSQLELLLAEEKRHEVLMADRKMQDAHNEFYVAAMQCVRAYRKCMNVGRANQGIPGSSTKLPKGFTFGHLQNAYGNPQFSTSDQMAMGLLRVEQDEQREAA